MHTSSFTWVFKKDQTVIIRFEGDSTFSSRYFISNYRHKFPNALIKDSSMMLPSSVELPEGFEEMTPMEDLDLEIKIYSKLALSAPTVNDRLRFQTLLKTANKKLLEVKSSPWKFKQGDRVRISTVIGVETLNDGSGVIEGVAQKPQAILGAGYIIKLDSPIEDYPFTHIMMYETFLTKI